MIEEYFVRYYNELVAELTYDTEKDLFAMNLLRPDLFFEYIPKLFFTDAMVRRWVDRRVTPEYQGGYKEKFVTGLGFKGDEKNLRWEIFKKTRGCNIKDRVWLAFSEDEKFEDSSPWYIIENPQLFPGAIEEVE